MKLCSHLRWKSYHGATWATVEELVLHHAEHRGPFTCLRTGHPWGPDGAITKPDRCQEGRACFDLSPRSPVERHHLLADLLAKLRSAAGDRVYSS